MIVAHDLRPARPCRLVCAEQRRGFDLEAMARIGSNIGGGQDRVDAHCRPITEQQPAAFMAAGRFCLALDRLGDSP